MSDTPDPESPTLSPSKAEWSFSFFGMLSWAWNSAWSSGSTTPEAQQEDAPDAEEEEETVIPPSPAEQMLATLRDPRPAELTAPESASTADKGKVDNAYRQLITLLESDAPDVSQAETQKDALEKLVVKVIKDTGVARRKALYKQVGDVQPPLDATPAELRALAKTRGVLLKQIKGAKTLEDLDNLEKGFAKDLKTYSDAVDDIVALAKERTKLETELAAFKKTRKSLSSEVDRGFYQYLIGVEDSVAKAIPGVSKPKDFKPLTKNLTDANGLIGAAKAYATHYDGWMRDTEIYILSAAANTDKEDIKTHRDALAKAAATKAAAGDFTGAKGELAKFDTHAQVNGTTAGEVAAFGIALASVQNHPALKKMSAISLPGKSRFDQSFSTLRKKGAKDKNYADATTELNALKLDLDKIDEMCDLWVEIAPFAIGNPTSDASTKFDEADNECSAGNWAAALTKLKSISTDEKRKASLEARLKNLRRALQPLGFYGHAAAHGRLDTMLNAVQTDLDDSKFDDASTKLDGAKNAIDDTLPWAELLPQARITRARLDPTDKYKLLDAADKEAGKHDYPKALAALKTAITNYEVLETYQTVLAQLQTARTAFDDPSEELSIADEAIDAADKQVTAANVADAIKTLRGAIVSLGEAAVEAGQWLKLLEPVKSRHAKVKGHLELAKVIERIDNSLKEATDAADNEHDFPKATTLLEAHSDLLKDAAEYAALRPRVHRIKDGIDRAVTQLASVPDIKTVLYDHTDDSKMRGEIKVADDFAVAGEMRKARDAYARLLTAWQPRVKAAAEEFEMADGNGSNAGHSLDRHGSDISDEKLLRRLTTGIAADDQSSPTQKSSKFASFEAWMEGRELSAQEAEKTTQHGGAKVSLAGTTVPAHPDAVINIPVEIDHSGPIDEAYVGLKPAPSLDAKKGKLTDGRTYETYERLTGITKSTALWLFEIDWASIPAPKPGRKDQTPAKFIDLYEAANGGTSPANIPGKWVMMQLFPKVDGWDQELQDYV